MIFPVATNPAEPSNTTTDPRVIVRPTAAFVNLAGQDGDEIARADAAAIGPIFHGNAQSATTAMPTCDVLFLYCTIDPSGLVVEQQQTLRELIARSHARIAVIATEMSFTANPGLKASLARGSHPPVSYIVTIKRGGGDFARFYVSLFRQMWAGTSMMMAWVNIAPQGAPRTLVQLPASLFIPEAGDLFFAEAPVRRENVIR